jgi:hypothetical protein
MREYDDDIRLYTPVLQRIIILVAVIVAVPVVLWTITAFVRAYVAPPKVPTFQRMTILQPSDSAAADQQTNPLQANSLQAPAGPSQSAATPADGRTALLEIKKPSDADQSQTPAASAFPGPQIAALPPPAQPAAAPQPQAAVPAQPPAAGAPLAPMGGTTQNLADKTGGNAAVPSGDRFAWPNPPTTAGGGANAAPDAPGSNDAAALPAVKPIAGLIPLPRRRPNEIALAQTDLSQSARAPANAPQTSMALNSIPLPRARPAAAPEPVPETTNDASFLDRGAEH